MVMGPSGCGKSRIGAALAKRLGAPLLEADDFHSAANRQKMASGTPLTDEDRAAWLDSIISELEQMKAPHTVLACSALTDYAQDRLSNVAKMATRFILLQAPKALLAQRMERRSGHFMPVSLLDSQLEALRAPQDAMIIDARETVETIITRICTGLNEDA